MLTRMVLWLYPRRVRANHTDEVLAAIHDERAARTGLRGMMGFVVWLVLDVVRSRGRSPLPGRREGPRRVRRMEPVFGIGRELRFAIRSLTRAPMFTATAALTLALGIGATTSVFSVVDSVLLRPLPYPQSQDIVLVSHPVPGVGSGHWAFSSAGYFYFKTNSRALQDLGAYRGTAYVLTGDGEAERVAGARITASVLSTLQTPPLLGRAILPSDDVPGAQPVALLGYDLWARRYGSDESLIGRTITIGGSSIEVVGVMPRGFHFPTSDTDLWMPLILDPNGRPINQHIFSGVGRLSAGVSIASAVDEFKTFVSQFPETFPTAYSTQFMEESGFDVAMVTLLDDTVGTMRRALWVVLGTVALVLLMACANVANLNLVRAEGRRREVALRMALGADPGHLFWHYMTESVVLAVLGGLAGVAVAFAGVELFSALAPVGLPRIEEIGLDGRAVAVALGLTVFSAIFFGTFSLMRGDASRLADHLKEGASNSTPGRGRQRIRAGLVVSQVAMALVLLMGSGLLLRSFVALRSLDLGFDARDAFTVRLSISPAKYPDLPSRARFFDAARDRLGDLPTVSAAGMVNQLEIVGRAWDNATEIADLPDGGVITRIVDQKIAGAGYFEALGMRLVEGRFMERRDQEMGAPGAVITRATAEEFWPGESALGKRMRPLFTDLPWHTIVGVIEDVRTEGVRKNPEPTVYFPFTVVASSSLTYVLRSTAPSSALLAGIRRAVQELDPDVPLAEAVSMERIVADDLAATTFTLSLLGVAAAMALLLGAVGIYGMISYAVSERVPEIGIRLALGASGGNVGGMVLRQTMRLAFIGIALGLAAAVAGNRFIESLLFGVQANDPLTFIGVCVVLVTVAALAGYLPARRAAGVDPLESLRAE